jgi:hypothetical protein
MDALPNRNGLRHCSRFEPGEMLGIMRLLIAFLARRPAAYSWGQFWGQVITYFFIKLL